MTTFRTATFDGVPLVICYLGNGRAMAETRFAYLGTFSSRVAVSLRSEACVTKVTELPALVAELRTVDGSLFELQAKRARSAARKEASRVRAARPHSATCPCVRCWVEAPRRLHVRGGS